ncbi:MAG: Fic/DOC family protein [Gammaproteobacteria bacterium]
MADPYLLPGTNVLRNRCGITDAAVLADFERTASLARVAELERRPVDGDFDLQHLCAIHRRIFCDVYDWAGAIRTVDIAKGMLFCRCEAIESESRRVFGAIARDNYLVGFGRDAFVTKLAGHWGEVNALHPFREGNTRTQRVFFQQLAQVASWPIDWSKLDYKAFIDARHENLRTANSAALAAVLDPAVVQ